MFKTETKIDSSSSSSSTSCYSVVDTNLPLTRDMWVVSIARKPEGKNPEHAFLIVEGMSSFGQYLIRRYDLFIDEESKEGKATIYIKADSSMPPSQAPTFFRRDFIRGERIYPLSWGITRDQAATLYAEVQRDHANPPQYQVSGDRSLIAKSRSAEGHSCFTWAREKLLNLKDPRIEEAMQPMTWDRLAARTSSYITGEAEPGTRFCCVL